MVRLEVTRTIAAAPEPVFDWLTEPTNLTSAPLFLRVYWADGYSAPSVGAVRKGLVVGAWLREVITAYDAPHSYSYRVVRSVPPAKHDGGTVTLTPTGAGTHVEWVTSYSIPSRAGGKVTEAVTERLFRSSFQAILAACAKAVER